MSAEKTLTILVPAYRAAATIGATLRSIFDPLRLIGAIPTPEVVLVDDGSPDGEELKRAILPYPNVRLLVLPCNMGKLAAINAGAQVARGEVVMILDADDTLVPDWPKALKRIFMEWPASAPVCFSACYNQNGRATVSNPEYRGLLSFSDLLNERNAGEYLPLIRGEMLRGVGYIPIPGAAACEVVSYLNFAKKNALWVSPEILRIYHESRPDSLSSGWGDLDKSEQMVRCYDALFSRFAENYVALAPRVWRTKRLRLAVYLMLAGRPEPWRMWWQAAHWSVWRESIGSALMLLLGKRGTVNLVRLLKRHGWVRRYG